MGKKRQRHVQTAVLRILFLSVSCNLPPYKGNTIMEIYCAVVGRSRSGDSKSRGSVGGVEMLINAKMCFVFSFSFF